MLLFQANVHPSTRLFWNKTLKVHIMEFYDKWLAVDMYQYEACIAAFC